MAGVLAGRGVISPQGVSGLLARLDALEAAAASAARTSITSLEERCRKAEARWARCEAEARTSITSLEERCRKMEARCEAETRRADENAKRLRLQAGALLQGVRW